MSILKIRDKDGKIIEVPALKGDTGESAYEIDKKHGYTGTEQEWIDGMTAKRHPTHYASPITWYIDGVNGDDSNDGTDDSPWKTIDHFFRQANTTTTDIRCYIKSPGRYTITNPVINGVTVHITATVPGVELYSIHATEALVFYNCHLNFRGVSNAEPLRINSASGYWYSENCSNNFTYVCSEVPYNQYGGTIDIDGCTLYKVSLHGVNGQISKCTYTITDPAESCLDITEGSVMRLTGTTTFADRSEPGTGNSCFIYAIGSVVSILHGVTTLTNQPAYGLRMDNCLLTITTQRLNYYQTRSINGNYFGSSSLVITENTNLVEVLNNKFNYKDCTALAATSNEFENLLKTSEYYQNNGVYIYQNNVYINSYYDIYIRQYKLNNNVLYCRYSNNNGSSWTAFTARTLPTAVSLDITDTNNIYEAINVNDALQEVKLQADATKSEVDTFEYEVGTWGGESEQAWWDAGPQYTISGTYQKFGDYVTITARAIKPPKWSEVSYSLPFIDVSLGRSGTITCNGDDVADGYTGPNKSGDEIVYIISTGTNTTKEGFAKPTVHIKRQDGQALGEGTVTFTLTYKYKGDSV
jgi:hypothetical protein